LGAAHISHENDIAEKARPDFKLTHYHQTLRVTPAMEAGIADHSGRLRKSSELR
jgi:hypothetical protein